MPIFFAVFMMRQAISPRLAIKILRNMLAPIALTKSPSAPARGPLWREPCRAFPCLH
jgi:hypothetical protein